MNALPTVRHLVDERRYEIGASPLTAVLEYEKAGDRITITHTFVPPALRGQGLAEALVRTALADARAAGYKVVPACSYVARFIERHQEYQPLLAE